MGERVRDELAGMGLQVQWQEVEDGRPNVVGLWETGVGGGKSLMFNGHHGHLVLGTGAVARRDSRLPA